MTVTSWREELRQDRLTRAQIDRDREATAAQLRIADRQARIQARQEQHRARLAARQQARHVREQRRAAHGVWVRAHVVDLLFVPVIVVPALLAWSAMGAYGDQIYGPPGLALPALSEGAMWAFAAATTITRRRHPDRPLWHLRLGTLVFAVYGAVLNFTHGMTAPSGPHGPGVGTVMAVVSVAGVVAHQLVTAGPRRSRAERAQARIDRAVARRELAARRAAVRHAAADLDEHGNARLVYEPGLAAMTRRRGRTRLDPALDSHSPGAPSTAGPACPWPRPAPVLPPGALESSTRSAHSGVPAGAPDRGTGERTPARTRAHKSVRTRARTRGAVSADAAEVHFAAVLAEGRHPSMRRIKAELRTGQDRATQIHDQLAAIAPQGDGHACRRAHTGRTA